MLMVSVGVFEDDDVAALQRTVGEQLLIPRSAAAKDELVDEEMVANLQRSLHRSGGNLERLNHEAGPKEREKHGHQQRFQVFGNRRGILVRLLFLRFYWCNRIYRLFDLQRSFF